MLPQALQTVQLPPIGLIAPPPPGLGWIALTFLQPLLTYTRYHGELTQPVKYSKFSTALTEASSGKRSNLLLTGRQGMLVAYAPAFLVSSYYYRASSSQNFAALLLAIHFAKRLLEVMFVHKYSGTMEISVATSIGVFYALDTLWISSTSLWMNNLSTTFVWIGFILTVIGQLGNGYHHYVLATLRKDEKQSQKQRYVAPRGGLFEFVAAPHYFFELVSWLGIAFAAQQLNAFLEVLSHTGYLMGRSYQANEFYRTKFDSEQWPRSRRNIFPFVW